MSKISASEILTQKNIRFFIQKAGPGPENAVMYSGTDGQYMVIEDTTNPKTGGRTPINVHDPRRIGQYRRVGESVSPAEFPTATVQFMQAVGFVPEHLSGFDCPLNFYVNVGKCEDLSDLLDANSAYWKIYSFGNHESTTEKGGAFDADDGLMDGLDFTFDYVYPIGKLSFGEEGAAEVTLEMIDGVYGSRLSCGECGPNDDGTQLWYGVQINDTGVPPAVKYTVDGFNTVASAAITGAIDTDVPIAIDIVGRYLVVVYQGAADTGYFVAEINSLTGVPGTWTKVTTGFVLANAPTDIWVANPREVWFSGLNGYVYKSTSILQGVEVIDPGNATANDLNRIQAYDNVVVAVGDSATVIVSYNRGDSFAVTANAPGAANLTALAIWNEYAFWVGDDTGDIYYTLVRGESAWVQYVTALTLAAIQDIVWVNGEVGYIAASTSDPAAVLYATFTGFNNTSVSNPGNGRFINYGTFDRGNRISYPMVPNQEVASDNIVVCGLADDGSDGIILHGKTAVK